MRRLASRRFIITAAILLITTVMLVLHYIDSGVFQQIMIWLSGIYVIGKPVGDIVSQGFIK